jgi:hypothetical protein
VRIGILAQHQADPFVGGVIGSLLGMKLAISFCQQGRLVRDYTECMVDCAAKLAPYVHARIGEVPVKSDGDTEYVIVVPPVVHASDEWARSVKAKLIDAKPNGNGSGNGSGR